MGVLFQGDELPYYRSSHDMAADASSLLLVPVLNHVPYMCYRV